MENRERHSVQAFTIFEVTVVLAIMSVLIGIISFSLNRFSEQLHLSSGISAEMNEFRLVRSTLWREFYFADSIRESQGELTIYEKGRVVAYRIIDDRLHRVSGSDWADLHLNMERIHSEVREDATVYHVDFLWKGDVMHLDYHFKPGADRRINEFFNHRDD